MSEIIFKNLLVVEDQEWDREFIVKTLTKGKKPKGISVDRIDTAVDVNDALGKIKGTAYDLIITDMMMPNARDGIELIKAVRENPATKSIPVIVASAADTIASVIEAADAGANGFVPKPYTSNELEAAIKLLSNSRYLFSGE